VVLGGPEGGPGGVLGGFRGGVVGIGDGFPQTYLPLMIRGERRGTEPSAAGLVE